MAHQPFLCGRHLREWCDEHLRAAITALKESGSIDYAMNKALGFVEEGKAALKALPDSEAKKNLAGLADYMTERKY